MAVAGLIGASGLEGITAELLDVLVLVGDGVGVGLGAGEAAVDVGVVDGDDDVLGDVLSLAGAGVVVGDVGVAVVGGEEALACCFLLVYLTLVYGVYTYSSGSRQRQQSRQRRARSRGASRRRSHRWYQ